MQNSKTRKAYWAEDPPLPNAVLDKNLTLTDGLAVCLPASEVPTLVLGSRLAASSCSACSSLSAFSGSAEAKLASSCWSSALRRSRSSCLFLDSSRHTGLPLLYSSGPVKFGRRGWLFLPPACVRLRSAQTTLLARTMIFQIRSQQLRQEIYDIRTASHLALQWCQAPTHPHAPNASLMSPSAIWERWKACTSNFDHMMPTS